MGKKEKSPLNITIENSNSLLTISIRDDGRGIDVDQVTNKSLQNGVVDNEKLKSMPQSEKLKLVFSPGLSTQNEVNDYSGRGVGLDVVQNTIEKLGGSLEIKSENNNGTEFILKFPTSEIAKKGNLDSLYYGNSQKAA